MRYAEASADLFTSKMVAIDLSKVFGRLYVAQTLQSSIGQAVKDTIEDHNAQSSVHILPEQAYSDLEPRVIAYYAHLAMRHMYRVLCETLGTVMEDIVEVGSPDERQSEFPIWIAPGSPFEDRYILSYAHVDPKGLAQELTRRGIRGLPYLPYMPEGPDTAVHYIQEALHALYACEVDKLGCDPLDEGFPELHTDYVQKAIKFGIRTRRMLKSE